MSVGAMGPSRKERVDRGIKVRSESLFVLCSPRELLYLAAPRALLILLVLALPLLLLPWPYWNRVLLAAFLMGFSSLSFDLLANHVGLVCLGGAFFYGVGGYTAAILNTRAGLPVHLSLPLATGLGAAFCTLTLYPCLPLKGIYFAVVTLVVPLLATRLIEAANLLGGTEGLRGVDGFGSAFTEQYILAILLLLALFGLRRYMSETPGLIIRAVKDNDQAVRASGISVTLCRTKALFIASLLGCFAGAYYTHMYRGVGPSAFAMDLSILPIAATVVGGSGTLAGPVLGCLILVPLGEFLREFGSLRVAIFAVILTVVISRRSEGLLPLVARKYHQFERSADV